MDIASLVRAVIGAFEDASKLVKRIRSDRDTTQDPLPEEPARDLLDSLALGPVIVRGHYDHDVKRFGEQYACGDGQAREQMKDVLINLQMTLIINLRSIMMDDVDLDFNALQSASDDCRVNAGVCLGQLAQRLSSAIQAQAYYPQNMTPYPPTSTSALMAPMSPSLGYSSSRSTHSSAAYQTPRTPDPMLEQFNNLAMSPNSRQTYIERKTSTSSGGSQPPDRYYRQGLVMPRPNTEFITTAPPVGGLTIDEVDRRSMRRRSSQALAPDDSILLLFPQPDGQPILSAQPNNKDTNRDSLGNESLTHSPELSRASSGHQSQGSRDRFGPDDFGDEERIRADGRQYSHGTIYDMYQPPTPERQPSNSHSYSQRVQATNQTHFDYVRYLQENARPPRPQPRSDSLTKVAKKTSQTQLRRPTRTPTNAAPQPPTTRDWTSRPSLAVPIPVELSPTSEYRPPPPTSQGVPPSPPAPRQNLSNVSKQLSPTASVVNPPTSRAESILTVGSSVSAPPAFLASGPLALPTEKNLLGFCKGAFRLQIGLEAKAFKVANRPVGYASMIPYWRCEKCSFEGPVHNSSVLAEGKKKSNYKPVKLFDPKIRTSDSGVVRYKWAFLAKCHVVMKGMVPYETALGQSGAFGTFGCIFCAAEGKQRGWLDKVLSTGDGASLAGSGASVKSGHTANTAVRAKGAPEPNSTPIFGNVGSFMAHLEAVHRPEDGWPNPEMQGRMKLIVGRAGTDEDGWDINILPLP